MLRSLKFQWTGIEFWFNYFEVRSGCVLKIKMKMEMKYWTDMKMYENTWKRMETRRRNWMVGWVWKGPSKVFSVIGHVAEVVETRGAPVWEGGYVAGAATNGSKPAVVRRVIDVAPQRLAFFGCQNQRRRLRANLDEAVHPAVQLLFFLQSRAPFPGA